MKKCPFCGEEIQDEAIKCRYCKEFLDIPKKILDDPKGKHQKDEAPVNQNASCSKCGFKRIEGDEECPRCGVTYDKRINKGHNSHTAGNTQKPEASPEKTPIATQNNRADEHINPSLEKKPKSPSWLLSSVLAFLGFGIFPYNGVPGYIIGIALMAPIILKIVKSLKKITGASGISQKIEFSELSKAQLGCSGLLLFFVVIFIIGWISDITGPQRSTLTKNEKLILSAMDRDEFNLKWDGTSKSGYSMYQVQATKRQVWNGVLERLQAKPNPSKKEIQYVKERLKEL